MDGNWSFNRDDEEAIKELDGFVPEKVFDIHAHIYRVKDLNLTEEGLLSQGPEEKGVAFWRECLGKILSKAPQKALIMPFPTAGCNIDDANKYLIEQLCAFPENKGLIMITPDYPLNAVLELLENKHVVGFKPYHLFSRSKPTFDSPISAFIPEWAWELANERHLAITLHMVKDRALADEDNQRIIREKCIRYPGVKLILAHAARGFHAPNTVKGIKALRGLENVWFDTSGICEVSAIKAILKEFGQARLLWGSDFPVSQIRGKCVTIGHGFLWIQQDTVNGESLWDSFKPILLGIESLRALKEAVEDCRLDRQAVEDIFYNNAVGLIV